MAGAPEATAPLALSTRDVPPPARPAALRALLDQGVLPIEPLSGATPEVDLVKWRLPGASLLDGRFAGVRQIGFPGAGDDDVFFGINESGASLARQCGNDVAIEAGEAIALDLADGPFAVLRPVATRLIGLRLDRRLLPRDRPDAVPALRPVSAGSAALRLLARYLRAVLDGDELASPAVAEVVIRHASDLVALALAPVDPRDRPGAAGSVRAARLRALKADIDHHLTDGSLSVAGVAARHRITPRYLHLVFEGDGRTFSRYVLDGRLDLAHRLLLDPRRADRTVTSIAHDVGFGDASYFNRTFRMRFGITPSELRRRRDG